MALPRTEPALAPPFVWERRVADRSRTSDGAEMRTFGEERAQPSWATLTCFGRATCMSEVVLRGEQLEPEPRARSRRGPDGLRINEALSLTETDVDERRASILVRHGKNDRRREVGMDAWGWTALQPWLAERVTLPVGPLFCVIAGPTRGHAWSAGAARLQLHQDRAGGWRPPALRAAPAPPCPCCRAAERGRPATADPAPAGAFAPLHDRHVSAGDLLRGDHLHRSRSARADDARQRRPRPVEHLAGARHALPRSQRARPGSGSSLRA